MAFILKWNKHNWRNPIITTDVMWILRAAWGRRRVSSKAAPGTKPYGEVTANLSMWLSWWRHNRKMQYEYVVVTASGADHGAAYGEELEQSEIEAAARKEAENAKSQMSERLDELQRLRHEARLAGNFALADSIRDEIVAAGFVVSDVSLKRI